MYNTCTLKTPKIKKIEYLVRAKRHYHVARTLSDVPPSPYDWQYSRLLINFNLHHPLGEGYGSISFDGVSRMLKISGFHLSFTTPKKQPCCFGSEKVGTLNPPTYSWSGGRTKTSLKGIVHVRMQHDPCMILHTTAVRKPMAITQLPIFKSAHL